MTEYVSARLWRTHSARDRHGNVINGAYDWCQDAECPEEQHYLYEPFVGTTLAASKWDGVKH